MGDKDAKTLVHTLVYLLGKYFALRSGEEHRGLTFVQLQIIQGDNGERTRLRYTSFREKNFDVSSVFVCFFFRLYK